jgi:hypothetical protein
MRTAISRSRVLLPTGVMLVVVAAGGCTRKRPPPPQIARLSDGTLLRLETATYGKRHQFELRAPGLKGLLGAHYVAIDTEPRDSLVVWFSQPGSEFATGWRSVSDAAAAVDEHGCRYDILQAGAGQSSGSGMIGQWQSPQIHRWTLETFPRRRRIVALRFYDRNRDKPVAEFTVPNPTPGPHPTWTAEPYPITKRDGDLAFTLVRLHPDPRPDVRLRLGARASFSITQNGRPTTEWEPVEMTVSDATGNVVTDRIGRSSQPNPLQRTDDLGFLGLCPYEPAWRLHVEFSRTAHSRVAPAQCWTVHGVPVPKPNTITRTTATATRDGATLQLLGIAGAGTVSWSKDSSGSAQQPYVRLRVSSRDARRPTLRAADEKGRQIIVAQTSYAGSPNEQVCQYYLQIPPGAKNLDLTFAVHKSRFAEFVARPSRS